jgi:hypothetical protein
LDLEALVHGYLGIVGLDLAKIRIRGGIQNELVIEYRFGIQSDLTIGVALAELGMIEVAQI